MNRVVILLILMLASAVTFAASGKVIRFPANQQYGYVRVPDSTRNPWPSYQIVRIHDSGADSLEILRTLPSLPLPCSRDAVSYLSHTTDSSYLIVLNLDSLANIDTVYACARLNPKEGRGTFYWPRKDRSQVIGLYTYYFLLKDSILVWKPLYPGHIDPVEIGHIQSNGNYLYDTGFADASIGRPDLDYTEILISELPPALVLIPGDTVNTEIISYSASHRRLSVITSVSSFCWEVSRRKPDDTLWCIGSGNNLCFVDNGQLVRATNVDYPVTITGYRLYPDRMEIDTVTCCGEGVKGKE